MDAWHLDGRLEARASWRGSGCRQHRILVFLETSETQSEQELSLESLCPIFDIFESSPEVPFREPWLARLASRPSLGAGGLAPTDAAAPSQV